LGKIPGAEQDENERNAERRRVDVGAPTKGQSSGIGHGGNGLLEGSRLFSRFFAFYADRSVTASPKSLSHPAQSLDKHKPVQH
jgi:hypothetical protein